MSPFQKGPPRYRCDDGVMRTLPECAKFYGVTEQSLRDKWFGTKTTVVPKSESVERDVAHRKAAKL